MKKVRIGIDVGGTFTDAVVIDNQTNEVIAKAKTKTTHHSEFGVASGIIGLISKILKEESISPNDVVFIAHGTTQATNALLEGDVAKVGLIGIGESKIAKKELTLSNIELSKNKFLEIENHFLDKKDFSKENIIHGVEKLLKKGVEVIVISEAYSIDDPKNEITAVSWCQDLGIYATSGHEVSELYGLKVRTTTAVINASLIPKMMETAKMCEKVVKEIGINCELMIMRADGGVMSIKEVRKRPILTMLSGLAAGVAGALMYGKITEGIFFEIGGTSIDISAIKNGHVVIKNAQVGGHKTYLRSLDIRTLGIAGGSMIRIHNHKIVDVGPRSAHLANLEYECFSNLKSGEIKLITPVSKDPNDFVIIEDSQKYAYTLAGAANVLGFIPEDDYAYGNQESNNIAWEILAKYLNVTKEVAATQVLDIACEKVFKIVKQIVLEYELEENFLTLIGGGGSAAVLTGYIAKKHDFRFKITNNAPYISTIGVALAMVQEQIERSIINPTNDDIRKLRSDIIAKIIESGALEDTVEVSIEVDNQKNKLIATASGSTEFKAKETKVHLNDDELLKNVSDAIKLPTSDVNLVDSVGRWKLYNGLKKSKKLFGLVKSNQNITVVSDLEGVITLRKFNSFYHVCSKDSLNSDIDYLVETLSSYSDAGKSIPSIFIFTSSRMYDYSGLHKYEQLQSVISMDLEFIENHEYLIIVGEKK